MEGFRQKIRDWVGSRNQAEAAKILGISQPYLAQILKGRRTPRIKKLNEIMSRMNSNLSDAPASFLKEASALYGSPAAQTPFTVRVTYSKKFEEPQLPQTRESDYLPVPIVEARVAAGTPEVVTTEQVVDIAFIHRRALHKKNPKDLICTFVKGESMVPVLHDGAIVCIDMKARPQRKHVPPGSIWAIRKDDGVVVKHLLIADSAIILVSANTTYPPEAISNPEAVIGRVVWAWQEL